MHGTSRYFLQQRSLADFDADDGKAIGARLMFGKIKGEQHRHMGVKRIFKCHKGLVELEKEYPWITFLFEELMKGHLAMNTPKNSKLGNLSVKEAMAIGKSLVPCLKARKTPQAGIYQWQMQNPSMVSAPPASERCS